MKKEKRVKGPLWKSFYYAFQGIKQCLFVERNMIIHFFFMCLVIICGVLFNITRGEWIICILLFGFVFAMEFMNTAIETTIDICMPERDPRAKLAKDTAAGSVLIAAIVAAIIGLIIFIPYGMNALGI